MANARKFLDSMKINWNNIKPDIRINKTTTNSPISVKKKYDVLSNSSIETLGTKRNSFNRRNTIRIPPPFLGQDDEEPGDIPFVEFVMH